MTDGSNWSATDGSMALLSLAASSQTAVDTLMEQLPSQSASSKANDGEGYEFDLHEVSFATEEQLRSYKNNFFKS